MIRQPALPEERAPDVAEIRGRVLAHPFLAAKLCARPLGYAQPAQWNGFVPPEFWCGVTNDSPRRAALVSIVAAAFTYPGCRDVTGPADAPYRCPACHPLEAGRTRR